jgi:hypothetical protein
MVEFQNPRQTEGPGRRALLRFSAAGLVVPLGAMAPAAWRTGTSGLPDTAIHPPICRVATDAAAVAPGSAPRELKITWNTNAVCNVGVAVAESQGFFAKRNLKVEKINFAGATDQLLELLATGKADAGVGMALAWMKPLEQGFDVKLTAAIHGGCIRLPSRLLRTRHSWQLGARRASGRGRRHRGSDGRARMGRRKSGGGGGDFRKFHQSGDGGAIGPDAAQPCSPSSSG